VETEEVLEAIKERIVPFQMVKVRFLVMIVVGGFLKDELLSEPLTIVLRLRGRRRSQSVG
jgi:hypothetical protein